MQLQQNLCFFFAEQYSLSTFWQLHISQLRICTHHSSTRSVAMHKEYSSAQSIFISCQFFGLFLIFKSSSSLHLCSFDECFELVFLYFDEWSKFDFLSSIHEPPYPHIFTPIESASFSKPVVRTTIRNSLSFRYFVFFFLLSNIWNILQPQLQSKLHSRSDRPV